MRGYLVDAKVGGATKGVSQEIDHVMQRIEQKFAQMHADDVYLCFLAAEKGSG